MSDVYSDIEERLPQWELDATENVRRGWPNLAFLPNGAFLALLARVRELEGQRDAVLALHEPFEWSFGYGPVKSCKHCASLGAGEALSAWPCATVKALGEA